MSKSKILVVEDEKIIAEAVIAYLEKNEYEVIWTADGNEAIRMFHENKPDMVLLDLMLPGISGEEICKIIRKESQIPLIMMTAKSSEDHIIDGLNLGADDYITKPFSPRELVARVQSLFRRVVNKDIVSNQILLFNQSDLKIDCEAVEVKKKDEIINLTQSEYKLLVTMAKSPNRTYTRDELIQYAFHEDFDGFDRTIDSHIKNLRSKIETDSANPNYIVTVRGVGYKFNGEKQ
ncbi:MAG: response regulator [Anaerorhabdus sp.]|uniref:response regulator n=1 Tax=Anaerorhabdus sp. TaxID=1872524 RepID=UPI003A89B9B4